LNVSLIAAMDEGRVIGVNGTLPWRIPEEMKLFKRLTLGHACIMGRKTWESLRKPLVDRLNVVVTRQPGYRAEGATVADSLEAAIAACHHLSDNWVSGQTRKIFVIGGNELYRSALPLANEIYLTKVHARYEGDTWFPEFDESQYQAEKIAEGEGTPSYTTWLFKRPQP
jgi:dihydrofolate reductase